MIVLSSTSILYVAFLCHRVQATQRSNSSWKEVGLRIQSTTTTEEVPITVDILQPVPGPWKLDRTCASFKKSPTDILGRLSFILPYFAEEDDGIDLLHEIARALNEAAVAPKPDTAYYAAVILPIMFLYGSGGGRFWCTMERFLEALILLSKEGFRQEMPTSKLLQSRLDEVNERIRFMIYEMPIPPAMAARYERATEIPDLSTALKNNKNLKYLKESVMSLMKLNSKAESIAFNVCLRFSVLFGIICFIF